MAEPLTVLVYSDNWFAPHVATTLLSVVETTPAPLRFFVGSIEINDAHRERIQASVPDHPITWIDISTEWLDALPPTKANHVNFGGLHALDQLPGDVHRVLCMDVDVLVRHDLTPLWNTELDGTVLAAARCGWGLWTGRGLANFRELGIDGNRKYLQSGVTVVDLDEWRRRDLGAACLAYVARWHETMFLGDQEALNGVLDDAWTEVPMRWNWVVHPGVKDNPLLDLAVTQAELHEARTDPAVVHFAGKKPWRWAHPTRDELPWVADWEAVAMRTTYADWYDAHRREGLAERAAARPERRSPLRRLRRAASVLLHG